MKIKVHKITERAYMPTYGTSQAAGLDLHSCIESDVVVRPNQTTVIPTGLVVEIPEGQYGAVCSRSGLTLKHGIVVPNSPGIIDSDYRGELKIIVRNISENDFTITHGMRIAQMIIMKYENVELVECGMDEFSSTLRGAGGFGSTNL